MPDSVLLTEVVPGGGMWSFRVPRHVTLGLTAQQPGVNVGLLAYHALQPLERLNLPDTLKAQYTARLTEGHVLMSDMGRVLLSITRDTVGWHDPLGGHGNARLTEQKYGVRSYQEARNGWYRNAHDNFLIELGKHGLGARDLVANVNFFSRVEVSETGALTFTPQPPGTVELRAEMDVLVVLNTCPHPLDPDPRYAPGGVELQLRRTAPPAPDDFCRNFRPENHRSFELTEQLYLA